MDTKNNKNVILSFLSGFSAGVQKAWTRSSVSTELLPFLSLVIAPEMKSINIQLLKQDEKKELASVVDNLVSFGLKLVQQKADDGQYVYRLEP